MSRFLKSPEETVWQALSRQERRAYDRYSTLLTAQAAVQRKTTSRGPEEMHLSVEDAHRHWRRSVRECDTYLDRNRDTFGSTRNTEARPH